MGRAEKARQKAAEAARKAEIDPGEAGEEKAPSGARAARRGDGGVYSRLTKS
jgi:hypothetical protein